MSDDRPDAAAATEEDAAAASAAPGPLLEADAPAPREPSPLAKLALGALVFALTGGGLHFSGVLAPAREPAEPLTLELVPSYGRLPEFSLVEASGRYLTRAKLEGTTWVASFIFTTCAGTCPAIANRCRMLQALLPEGVKLVSITVDPDRDTEEVLAKWGEKYGRDPEKWYLATGDFLGIRKLIIEGFGLEGDDPANHSNGMVLVDSRGVMRGYYDSLKEEDMTKLVRDVNLVLGELQPGASSPAPPPGP